jgi:hypothetical protein
LIVLKPDPRGLQRIAFSWGNILGHAEIFPLTLSASTSSSRILKTTSASGVLAVYQQLDRESELICYLMRSRN